MIKMKKKIEIQIETDKPHLRKCLLGLRHVSNSVVDQVKTCDYKALN